MATIGPIGNAIFVNQMTPAATSAQNAHNNRVEFQNIVAQAAAQEEKKEIQEVRPTEENHEVDPDREHQRQEADENTKERKKHENNEEHAEQSSAQPLHKLDIKV